jgi:tRNA pseudouridine55 synthase
MDGVLNINKPSGVTSHDVVESVRKILHEKRIGHTGTLDPLATGVLVLCAGRATRIAQYLEAGEKEYKAIMRLGVTTDTLDAEGLILETRSYTPPDQQKIIDVLQVFIGSIMQRPPAFSAVKVAGVPSYKLAREGKAELLKPRSVTIYSIELTAFEDPMVSLLVRC